MAPPAPLPWPHVLDERRVRRGVDRDGLLHEPVKQLPAMAGGAPIEPERELIQVVVQMGPGHGALMGPEQPPFQERHDPMHARQQLRGFAARQEWTTFALDQ